MQTDEITDQQKVRLVAERVMGWIIFDLQNPADCKRWDEGDDPVDKKVSVSPYNGRLHHRGIEPWEPLKDERACGQVLDRLAAIPTTGELWLSWSPGKRYHCAWGPQATNFVINGYANDQEPTEQNRRRAIVECAYEVAKWMQE